MNTMLSTIRQQVRRLASRLRQQTSTGTTSPDSDYRAPEIIDVGPARELIAGATGKHTDGYSGYYWNNEG